MPFPTNFREIVQAQFNYKLLLLEQHNPQLHLAYKKGGVKAKEVHQRIHNLVEAGTHEPIDWKKIADIPRARYYCSALGY